MKVSDTFDGVDSHLTVRGRSSRMLRGRLARRALLLSAGVRSASTHTQTVKRVYVIAGEASGDAIGAKVIAALKRREEADGCQGQRVVVRGIGGRQMMAAGGFTTLFPMEDLSVMGLVEVLPHVLRLRRRLSETMDDIRAFQPDLVLTIDSKGFTFRAQKALASDAQLNHLVKRMHYVAPSVWAYKHRQRKSEKGFDELSRLLHKMLVILPFEEPLFNGSQTKDADRWCEFVGHPAVEDFLDFHNAYEPPNPEPQHPARDLEPGELQVSDGGLLQRLKIDQAAVRSQGSVFEKLIRSRRDDPQWQAAYRQSRGLPTNAFIVCALVGSRENEVRRTIRTVLEAVDALQRPSEQLVKTPFGIPMKLSPLYTAGCVVKRPIHVVLPTIQAVELLVQQEIYAFCQDTGASPTSFQVTVDADAVERIELFQAADAAVAVSGTIVMETTLAALPTVVVYRANRLTEVLAKLLAAVQFVSIPNLLLGRAEIPELLFRDCTAENITKALREIYDTPPSPPPASPVPHGPSQLAMALSTLTPWAQPDKTTPPSVVPVPVPVRGSDLVANAVWRELYPSGSTKDTGYL